MEFKENQESQNNLKKKSKVRRLTFFNFKTYCKATAINTVWYWHKDTHIDQYDNRIESSEISPCVCDQLIFNKDANGKRLVFSANSGGKIK